VVVVVDVRRGKFEFWKNDVGKSSLYPSVSAAVNGETGWKDSCVDSIMGEMAAYIHGNQGVLAGRLAGHETLL
jgi:hypothetical protein